MNLLQDFTDLPYVKNIWQTIKEHKVFSSTAAILVAVGVCVHLSVPTHLFSKPTSTVLTAADGTLLSARIADDSQWRFAPKDSVPDKFVACITAYEDRRFRYHLGIDPIAIARALVTNISQGHIAEGGSTLTMQIARMSRGNQQRTIFQKFIEALWAIDIELHYSKDEIMAMYAANAPMGGNVVGIDAASWRYFGVAANDLSWAENATLAVLPNAPALIHVSRNRDALKAKRDRLLDFLHNDGIISDEEHALALSEPLPGEPYQLPDIVPHYLDFLCRSHKGENITTTIVPHLQTFVQQTANSYCRTYQSNHIYNIAALVLDAESGDVLAYVGNSTENVPSKHVDIIQSERSPGSLLKPFLYAAMLTKGEITPRMLIADTPLSIGGFSPHNFSKSFSGAVHADEAIAQSLNVPLVRMLVDYNVGRFMNTLKTLGMKTLHYADDHYGASLILGGAEAKLWDLCHMYRNMTRILTTYDPQKRANEITGPPLSSNDSEEALSPAAVWWTLEAMSKLNRPEEEADWQQFASMKRVAWKTGTSWGSRDGWAIGTTPKYIVGVWVGNATGEGRAGLTGVGFAAPVMFDIFSHLDDATWFPKPVDDMDPYVVCRQSGHIASSVCELTDTLLLPRKCGDTDPCDFCHVVNLTSDGQWQVNSSCESVYNMHSESRFVLTPVMEFYYRRAHADYRPLPPYRDDCQMSHGSTLKIIYPENGASVVIPTGFSGTSEMVVMKATSTRTDATLFWHVDNNFITETETIHEMNLGPIESGRHRLTVVDDKGESTSIIFNVK